jgi:hypothetical protein
MITPMTIEAMAAAMMASLSYDGCVNGCIACFYTAYKKDSKKAS